MTPVTESKIIPTNDDKDKESKTGAKEVMNQKDAYMILFRASLAAAAASTAAAAAASQRKVSHVSAHRWREQKPQRPQRTAKATAAATAASTYKYVISSVNDTGNSGTATTEGGLVTFTITRSRVDNQAINEANDIVSQVYVSTETGTADHDDFIGISQQLVEFKKGQTTAEVQIQTLGDALSESEEYLTLELYKTLSDYDYGDFHSYGNAHIANDNSQANAINNFDYSITSSHDYGSAASEGTDIIFTITRS